MEIQPYGIFVQTELIKPTAFRATCLCFLCVSATKKISCEIGICFIIQKAAFLQGFPAPRKAV